MDLSPTEEHKPEERPVSQPPAPAGPAVGGVMDVKPPEAPGIVNPISGGAPAPERSQAMGQEPPVAPGAATPSPESSTASVEKPGLSSDLLAEAKKEVEKKTPQPGESQSAPKSKKKGGDTPKAAVAAAIIVALLLSAAAVFAYLKTKDASNNKPTVVNTTNQPSAATTEDVDETSKEIEKVINSAPAEKDFPESDLSEQTLGL